MLSPLFVVDWGRNIGKNRRVLIIPWPAEPGKNGESGFLDCFGYSNNLCRILPLRDGRAFFSQSGAIFYAFAQAAGTV